MSIQETLTQPEESPDKNTGSQRDVIFTARGSKRASRQIWRTGTMIGYESQNYRPPDELSVEFVDWPFSKLQPDTNYPALFEDHLSVVSAERPKYAVAPDIDGSVPHELAFEWADRLAEYAEIVIVVPKTIRPAAVPGRFRVGMPCQDRYGPRPWQWTDYRDVGEVHLLGGSPVMHREILKYYVPVESVDTTVPITAAKYGDYWSGKKWVPSDLGFYECLVRSYRNMRSMMNEDRRLWSPRSRNRKTDWETAWAEHNPDADLWGPDEVPAQPRNPSEVPVWLPDGIL